MRLTGRCARRLLLLPITAATSASHLLAQGTNGATDMHPSATNTGNSVLSTLGELLVQGGVLMIPIALASVLLLGLALERAWALRRHRVCPSRIWPSVRACLERSDVAGARVAVANPTTPLARVLHVGLSHWPESPRDLVAAIEDAGMREADDLQKHLPALQGIASVSPLLGLLGTVVGMIQSFLQVAKERAIGNPELLAEGIGQALVTTAAGLTVAIPALILFYYFRGRIRQHVREFDGVARELVTLHRRDGAVGHSAA
ncbi:MAG: MotA/TolQ/ExbB proton channel family protein [Planctomycetota bacterium]